MRAYNKIIFIIVGIVLLVTSIYFIGFWIDIPKVSLWLRETTENNQEWLRYLGLVSMILIGLVGLVLVALGIFRPITRPKLVLTDSNGRLEVPQHVLEKNLKYKLAEKYNVIAPVVGIKLQRNQKAKVKIKVEATKNQNVEQLANQINEFVIDYLSSQLDLKVVKPVTQITPVNRSRPVNVI
ncbi:alkaline shock response membrane anchor protein AmaP [Lentilactobacillus senioris]|uniref:alkaline shock response membrane anchor protein AmaP n=1 Tax=Lentilactobacillus senioris TaxID=931534 RepID=UPI003D28DFD4